MIPDNFLMFTGTSNGASGGITAGANTDLPTTGTQVASNIVDLGIVLGIPAYAQGGGARDLGIGDKPSLKLLVRVTTTFGGGTDLTCLLSGAPDNGSGSPGSYTIMWQRPAVVLEAALLAGTDLANVDLPRPVSGQAMPRFLRLSFISTGTHTSGAVTGTIVIDRDDQILGTTGAISGYPAGINVAN